MRKHDVRKWLYAILDLVPVILIPVFMVYSHRHTLTEQTSVDIQYKYQSNEVESIDDLVAGNIYQLNCAGLGIGEVFYNRDEFLYIQLLSDLEVDYNYLSVDDTYTEQLYKFTSNTFLRLVNDYDAYIDVYDFEEQRYIGDYSIRYFYNSYFLSNCIFRLLENGTSNSQIIAYTDYNVIESVQVNDTSSSIMNVFLDNFNNSINKYFNFTNVFNFGDIYNFLNTNLFGGNAPTIMFSIYNILVYEFLIDMLFIIYGVFMFIIDFINRMMDEAFNRSRLGGGR